MLHKVLLFVFLSPLVLLAQDITLARFPAISPAGDRVAFSYQGDIWVHNLSTKNNRRLTIHEAYESHPQFNSRGDSIAFESNRFGNKDIFTMPTSGGRPVRITYHSANDELSQWSAQGKLLFTTSRTYQQVEWNDELQQVAAQGGTPGRIFGALGQQAVQSPNGKLIAFVRGSCRLSREQYQGSANNDIWLYNRQNETYIQLTESGGNDFMPRFKNDTTLLCLSANGDRYNLQSLTLNPTGEKQNAQFLTHFANEGIRYYDVAGETIVMERDAHLYLLRGTGVPKPLALEINADYRFDPENYKTYRGSMDNYAISPQGQYAVATIHGEIFAQALDKDKKRAVNLSRHPYRERKALWLNDTTVIFNSDREGGQYDLYMLQSADKKKPQPFHSLKHRITRLTDTPEDETDFWLAPDGKQIVYRRGAQDLVQAQIKPGKITAAKTLISAWNVPDAVAWSPDSRYLAYSRTNLNFNNEIFIHPLTESREPVNVSMHPRGDYSPVWSPDGSKLAFRSNRHNRDADVWFAWLRREDWLQTKADREEGLYFAEAEKSETEDKKQENDAAKEVEPITIDFENIYKRLEQVTRLEGNEGSVLVSKDGETFYFEAREPGAKGTDVYSAKYDGSEIKQITKGGVNPSDLQWGHEGKKIYYLKGGKIHALNPENGKSETFAHKAEMRLRKEEEQQQVFHEMWKALDKNFYDPHFHGRNWDSLRTVHEPRIRAASTKQDFADMINLMLGQINASHMGYYTGGEEETQKQNSGLLGVELTPVSSGMKISYVLPDGPADRPHSRIHAGDIITAVNGEPLEPSENFYARLIQRAGKQVLLTVQRSQANGDPEEVVIRPESNLSREKYEAWVAERSRLVEEYSKGKLGYIHIRGMNMASFERFERELTASGYGKEGVVIDVRYNGGGWTTDYLMAVLNVRQHAYTIPRGATDNLQKHHRDFKEYYPFSERLPLSWYTKPSVALCNESSYSNAEIFSHAYKNLDIGTLVGQPTFGAVISTGGTRFMDGSFVRLPFRGWYVKATEKNMEDEPAIPDVLVKNAPNYRATGEDNQLRKAVEVLLQQL